MTTTAFGSDGWTWLNEPPQWTLEDGGLLATAGAETDFWRLTHDGGVRDSGHLFARRVSGDFRVAVTFRAGYRDRYDQAGLMMRIDERTWIKTGVELDGQLWVSAVVTRESSDWSVVPMPTPPADEVRIQLDRDGDTVTVRYSLTGETPDTLLRQACIRGNREVLVGPMCAAPTGSGFEARFTGLRLESPAETVVRAC
jgi:uncharacterized protein